jgi:hypothetical protein
MRGENNMRLIDADALLKEDFTDSFVDFYDNTVFEAIIENAPTVDIKTEVAREIFAEIEKQTSEELKDVDDSYHRMRIKGRNATFYEGAKQSLESLSLYFAELKNKYIGGVGE